VFEAISRWLRKGKGSKITGKSRLQLILVHDRTGVSPEILDSLRDDIFRVISKYFVVKENDVEMDIERDEDSVALVANIPILSMKRQQKQPVASE
jgi:cell division topological specificity factor